MDTISILCVSYSSDVLFFKKFYHIAFTFLGKVYHFVPLTEGGFESMTLEEFQIQYPKQVQRTYAQGNTIQHFGKTLTLNDPNEIQNRINFVKQAYQDKKIKYTAFGINCENVAIFILGSDFHTLNINERLPSTELTNFLGRSTTITSLLPFFKQSYNTIVYFTSDSCEDQKYSTEDFNFFVKFSNKHLQSYYDLDEMSNMQNLKCMFLYLFEMYN